MSNDRLDVQTASRLFQCPRCRQADRPTNLLLLPPVDSVRDGIQRHPHPHGLLPPVRSAHRGLEVADGSHDEISSLLCLFRRSRVLHRRRTATGHRVTWTS